MRTSTISLAIATILVVAACSSDDGDSSTPTDDSASAPEVTFDTVPTEPGTSPPTTGEAAPTTTLVPSEEADLPTAPPPSALDETPTTTIGGPLPVPTVQLVEAGRFVSPVGLATHPLDPRLFVVEQGGRIFATDDLSTDEVLDITGLTEAAGERGLLGLAFHPDLDLAYVNFTDSDGNTVVAEFAVDPVTIVFDRESFREVLTVEQPFGNHNGGGMEFGPDGHLYIGLGDGGAADDPLRAGLDVSTRLGKLLRIDPVADGDEPFSVPADNPFVGVDGADPTIWSVGLRNPWRFSFDPANGDLWIADVGQNEFEEINRAPAIEGRGAGRGLSFGWSAFEATSPFNADQPADGHTPPVVEYAHGDGDCSVSGGAVARSSGVTDLDGWYVYGDFCSGRIWGYDTTSPPGAPVVVELASLPSLTEVGEGPEGELYAVSLNGDLVRFSN